MAAYDIAAGVAVVSIIAYTMFGGADFGSGIWTLFATGSRTEDQRNALERAIGPVWETNHVWLILLVVTLFVVFPTAYAAIFTALYVPLFLALIGIVARGAAFAFRHYGARDSTLSRVSLRSFSVASLLTPFFLGTVVGAIAGGEIIVDGADVVSGPFAGWLQPFALMCGLIGLLLSAFLAAAYMVPRTADELRADFRRRAMISSLLLGVVTTLAIPVALWDAPDFASRLDRPDVLISMAITAALGLASLGLLWRGASRAIPPFAAATAGGVVVAWALAQSPHLIIDDLTIAEAAASDLMVRSFLWALPAGALILVPSLLLLYNTFSREVLHGDQSPH